MRIFLAVIVLVSCCALSGCGGEGGHAKTYPVTGVVKLSDGQPLPNATVSFLSQSGELARGATDEEGHFTLGTFKTGDGAIVGKQQVAVETRIVRGTDSVEPQIQIQDRFKTAATSGIEMEVTADGDNQFEIIVEKK